MNNSTTTKSSQWADSPYPLIETPKHKLGKTGYTDQYIETASTMCVVHNALIRGLNSIYLQGPNVSTMDFPDFVGYALCWHAVVHEHHTSEEDMFFPDIEKAVGEKGLLDGDFEQHKAFEPGLNEYSSYLEGLAGKEYTFDAGHLNTIIASFAPALCDHLASEIQSLLDLSRYGDVLPLQRLWDTEGKHTVSAMTKFNALPFFFLNLDITHEDYLWKDWPPIPSPARWVITHGFTLWHSGYWKFASCDKSGVPKSLYALGPVSE